MSHCSCMALLLLASLKAPAPDLERADLRWKFEKGKTFYQEMTTETRQTMKVMGQDISQNQKQTFIFSWTPEKQTADGGWIIKQKIEGIIMEMDIGGNKITYDSTANNNADGPLAALIGALVGSEFTLTFSKDFRVTKVEGGEELLKKLVQANPQMESLFKQILNEDALKQMSDSSFGYVPGKAVVKGDAWTYKSKLGMGPIGAYETTYKYTYEGKEGKLDRVKAEIALKYQLPAPGNDGGLPFQIVQGDLKSTKSTGVLLFNSEKGRVESSTMELGLKGTLTISIGGQNADAELEQSQKTTVKTTDTNPIKK